MLIIAPTTVLQPESSSDGAATAMSCCKEVTPDVATSSSAADIYLRNSANACERLDR